ncbi:SLAC1 anion channel family protein [Photobacterium sp. SDRW27]|uniref:SLAC1 anion channel family protein n=1 Tax=Photobacterium obscurum TaxID=2829490 RepID=UPI002244BCFC|nr:SLAC1 anion channel family protein [Photobacterium obscurum]MCW8328485.1 SLAC1 anion channel family protein [Photobacterium obscurum]
MSSPVITAPSEAQSRNGLKRVAYLPITLFSIVMGLAGLAIVWEKSFQTSQVAHGISLAIGILASTLLISLLGAYGWKIIRYPHEVRAELHHPVRLNFFPTLPIGMLLLSVFWQSIPALAMPLWSAGTLLQLILTLYVMSSWLNHSHFTIEHANPGWFIPVVGNIVVPINGVYFGYEELSWFFFSIGLLFWLVLLTIVMYRLLFNEQLPLRLTPTYFILLAPPSVGFISYTGLIGGLDNGARLFYYCALFLMMLLASNIVRFWRVPFFISSWAFSFPLAALSLATIKMAELSQQPWLTWLARLLVIILSMIVLWLILRTIQAARKGKICTPE